MQTAGGGGLSYCAAAFVGVWLPVHVSDGNRQSLLPHQRFGSGLGLLAEFNMLTNDSRYRTTVHQSRESWSCVKAEEDDEEDDGANQHLIQLAPHELQFPPVSVRTHRCLQ